MNLMRLCFVLATALSVFTNVSCDSDKDSERSGGTADVKPQSLDRSEDSEPSSDPTADSKKGKKKPAKVSQETKATIIEAKFLESFPELTLSLMVNNIASTIRKVEEAGGKVLYDPNLGRGQVIKFLIVTLPPKKVLDDAFIKSLDLQAISVDLAERSVTVPEGEEVPAARAPKDWIVPINDIGVDKLREQTPGQALGAGVRLAVVDTGVDASHQAFGDRVVFWADATQEGRVPVTTAEVKDGQVAIGEDKQVTLPEVLANSDTVYLAVFNEKAMGSQSSDDKQSAGKGGLDINGNGSLADEIKILAGKDADGVWAAFADIDADGEFSDVELSTGLTDYNSWRAAQRRGETSAYTGMIAFPALARSLSSPLLFETDAEDLLTHMTVGIDFHGHGTHVAGIAAGSGPRINGAAPEAEIMALKVCSDLTCTDSAIFRGLVEAFYNKQGLVPDVVNISLGSKQSYSEGMYDILTRDLAAKFGTVFFISASNEGPGYRTVNDLGSLGPAVLVGAHASRTTLENHYTLHPDVTVSQQNLLYFSSNGPSYTGELKPNIVAPGSAVSSLPLNGNRAYMYNGTSMSSPIAAGGTAAMLSLLKTQEEWQWYDEIREAKIAAVQGDSEANYSILTFPMAVRQVLENTADRSQFDNYSFTQIGYGLMNVNRAFQGMKRAMQSLRPEGDTTFAYFHTNFKINGNTEADRLYERDVIPDRAKKITLEIREDGEENHIDLENLETNYFTVKLAGVEEQDQTGAVRDLPLDRPLPFSVGDSLDEREDLSYNLHLKNSNKKFFYSVRHLGRMQPGKTYLARYEVYQGRERLLTLMDIVHKAEELTSIPKTHAVPAISSDPVTLPNSMSVEHREIGANTFHRYFVPVTEADQELNVRLGICHGAEGRLLVQVYDPDGYETESSVAKRSSELPSDTPTAHVKVATRKKKGLYEITVSAYSGQRLIDSQYDLLINNLQFRPDTELLTISAGSKETVAVANPSSFFKNASAKVSGLQKVIAIRGIKVIPNHRTFKAFTISAEHSSPMTTVRWGIDNSKAASSGWFGRIDHNIYRLDGEGNPEVAATAIKAPSGTNKIFASLPTGETLYAAVETYGVVPEDSSVKNAVDAINLEVTLGELDDDELALTSTTNDADSIYSWRVSVEEGAVEEGIEWRGSIDVTADDAKVSIPVIVKQ